jgi:DNA-binding GntR family transcriptional regulator
VDLGELEQVRVKSRAETAAQSIQKAIISGELQPGQRLIEQKLAAALGTSQPTVREALKELEHQGFVRRVPNKGTYVIQLGPEDIRRILDVRMVLELLAIERAAGRLDAAGGDLLRRTVEKMEAAAEVDDRASFHEADLLFHRQIWKLADNEYLKAALERLVFSLFAFVLAKQERTDFLAAAQQHRAILSGLLSGDSTQAGQAFIDNTLEFWRSHHGMMPETAIAGETGRTGANT